MSKQLSLLHSSAPCQCDHHANPHALLTEPFDVVEKTPAASKVDVPPVLNNKLPAISLWLSFHDEVKSILSLIFPMILTGLLMYSRSIISMLFLGRLGELALAGGSLAIGFANITGYSILSGLAMGMEPICGQAFGAGRHHLLGLTLYRTILLLLTASVPIALLWYYIQPLLLLAGQEPALVAAASTFLHFSLPDLFLQSIIHPLRIYLRTQSINLALTVCAGLAIVLHLPIN